MDYSSAVDVFLPLVAVGAAATVASLVALQTDRFSRWTMAPDRLQAKRRLSYAYHWKTGITKVHLQLEYWWAGSPTAFQADPEINFKQHTTYVSSTEEQEKLIQRFLQPKSSLHVTPLKVDLDPHDPTDEYYLFLRQVDTKDSGDDDPPSDFDTDGEATKGECIQVPLIPFCQNLQRAFENQLTATALCFVADASAGQASQLLEVLVQEAKTGVAVVREPLWMINVARLAEARILAKEKLHTLIFALCRLEAWAVRKESQQSHTVLISLPGQSTVATLLPIVQAVFPEDRHVFCYDGCVASVAHGILAQSQYSRSTIQRHLGSIVHDFAHNPIPRTVPLPSKSPLTKSLPRLEPALAELSVTHAAGVESWMSSVDAFVRLKEDDVTNGYLPYVCKLTYLTQPVGAFAPASESLWALSSVLQFVTGSRSRPIPQGVLDSAVEYLKDANAAAVSAATATKVAFTEHERNAVENCVFQHKSILIGNKTLKDTVAPRQHWTLKQASRAGCSCCGPDPYDEPDEEDDSDEEAATTRNGGMKVAGVDMSVPGAFTTVLNNNNSTSKNGESGGRDAPASGPSYVDGKMGFAFDPTRFS